MKYKQWSVNPIDVQAGRQRGEPDLQCGNPCPCGCSPSPWVSINDGETGMTATFDSRQELEQFKFALSLLELP